MTTALSRPTDLPDTTTIDRVFGCIDTVRTRDTRSEYNDVLHVLQVVVADLEPTVRHCQLCVHYDGGKCAKYKRLIPQEFLTKGCEAFEYQRIPF